MSANRWIVHVKEFASKYNMTYGDALKNPTCKATYRYYNQFLIKGSGDRSEETKEDRNLPIARPVPIATPVHVIGTAEARQVRAIPNPNEARRRRLTPDQQREEHTRLVNAWIKYCRAKSTPKLLEMARSSDGEYEQWQMELLMIILDERIT
jgi:hypothetical protein